MAIKVQFKDGSSVDYPQAASGVVCPGTQGGQILLLTDAALEDVAILNYTDVEKWEALS